MDKIKLLLSLRAWWRSGTLNFAAVLGAIAAMDISTGSGIIDWVVQLVVSAGVTQPTALAILVAVKAVADALLRAKTDRALDEK
jgi:hypothetical protein